MTGPRYEDREGAPIPAEPGGGYGPPTEPVPPASAEPTDRPTERPIERPAGRSERVPGRTRVSGIWVASIAAVVVLLLLLIFILQNGARVKINIFGANPTVPLGVALLLAAVLGALLVALIGAARVVQLRHTARKMARRSR
jgi:uncharacterized integral membrane protein